MKHVTLAAALAALASSISAPADAKDCGALPPPFSGPLFVGDGDTYYGVGYAPPIRIWGMNAPELRDAAKAETVPGMRARAFVADLLQAGGNTARCEPIEWDGYCRVVASCTTTTPAGVKDITLETLRAGYAYSYYLAKHSDKIDQAQAYAAAEAQARAARAGLWPLWLGETK